MIFFQHWFVQKRLNRKKVESTKVKKKTFVAMQVNHYLALK